ncbi:MAG: hypothetical protein HQL65_20450 [Magnetococcales bacterium]|nr:hypothetical protein [Magnetococcales bacterium]
MLNISFNDAAFKKALAQAEKQMRFAASVALTKTAQDAQEEVKRQLPKRFKIRTGWLAKGIRIRAARKEKLSASILVKDAFMELQESGGERKSTSGKSMGIPIGARPDEMSVTRPSKYPGELLKKTRYFISPITKKSVTARSRERSNIKRRMHNKEIDATHVGKMALWHRRGKKRLPIDLIYIFEKKVHIPPRFGFHDTAKKVVLDRFPRRFASELRS